MTSKGAIGDHWPTISITYRFSFPAIDLEKGKNVMEYSHSCLWERTEANGKVYYERCPGLKQGTDRQLVFTFSDADKLMRVLEAGELPPAIWVRKLPGICTECVLLRLAAKAKAKHGLLPGYIVAQAARFGSHYADDCHACFKPSERPSWVRYGERGYHLLFDKVARIEPIIVQCKGDIAYLPKTLLAARGFCGPAKLK
jgi:hypothetical protein